MTGSHEAVGSIPISSNASSEQAPASATGLVGRCKARRTPGRRILAGVGTPEYSRDAQLALSSSRESYG